MLKNLFPIIGAVVMFSSVVPAMAQETVLPSANDSVNEEDEIRQRLEQALIRYRNLAGDAREFEQNWLNQTREVIARVERRLEELRQSGEPLTATAPVTSDSIATPGDAPPDVPAVGTKDVSKKMTPTSGLTQPHTGTPPTRSLKQAPHRWASQLEQMALDLLNVAAECRAPKQSAAANEE